MENGDWLCDCLLGNIEFDVQKELNLDGEPIPEAHKPMLWARIQPYLDQLPEYQYLLENFK